MRVRVHVEGLLGSRAYREGEEPSALFNGVLEVDGHMIDEVGKIEAVFGGGQFTTVIPHLLPGMFEVVTHTGESWKSLVDDLDRERKKRAWAGTGRLMTEEPE